MHGGLFYTGLVQMSPFSRERPYYDFSRQRVGGTARAQHRLSIKGSCSNNPPFVCSTCNNNRPQMTCVRQPCSNGVMQDTILDNASISCQVMCFAFSHAMFYACIIVCQFIDEQYIKLLYCGCMSETFICENSVIHRICIS